MLGLPIIPADGLDSTSGLVSADGCVSRPPGCRAGQLVAGKQKGWLGTGGAIEEEILGTTRLGLAGVDTKSGLSEVGTVQL